MPKIKEIKKNKEKEEEKKKGKIVEIKKDIKKKLEEIEEDLEDLEDEEYLEDDSTGLGFGRGQSAMQDSEGSQDKLSLTDLESSVEDVSVSGEEQDLNYSASGGNDDLYKGAYDPSAGASRPSVDSQDTIEETERENPYDNPIENNSESPGQEEDRLKRTQHYDPSRT